MRRNRGEGGGGGGGFDATVQSIILLGHYNNTCKVAISVNSQHLLSPVSPESLNVNLQILQTPCHYTQRAPYPLLGRCIEDTLISVRSLHIRYLILCYVTC